MQVKANKEFMDLKAGKLRAIGDEFEASKERADELIRRKYVTEAQPAKKQEPPKES